MSLVDLFLDRRPSLGQIKIDCAIRETHSRGQRLSPYPVENGADRNDHIQDEPDGLVLEGLISDVELISFLGFSLNGFDQSRSRTIWAAFEALRSSHEPFLVTTGLQVYTSMVFADGESLVAERVPEEDGGIRFIATLTKYRVAFTTFAEALAAEIQDLAEAAAASGLQSTVPADPATAASAAGAL